MARLPKTFSISTLLLTTTLVAVAIWWVFKYDRYDVAKLDAVARVTVAADGRQETLAWGLLLYHENSRLASDKELESLVLFIPKESKTWEGSVTSNVVTVPSGFGFVELEDGKKEVQWSGAPFPISPGYQVHEVHFSADNEMDTVSANSGHVISYAQGLEFLQTASDSEWSIAGFDNWLARQ